MNEFLDDVNSPQLGEEDQNKSEESIHVAEIMTVINALKGNKSLGSDGLTREFYKTFQDQPVEILQQVFRLFGEEQDFQFLSKEFLY